MLIAIEAQRIFRKHKHGMDVVALELLKELPQHTQDEYILLAANGPDKVCVPAAENLSIQIVSGFTYAGWEQVSLPRALRKIRPRLVHCTANTAPLKCPVPFVLTLHDIIFLEDFSFGGSAYQNIGNLYRRSVVPDAIKNAAAIITVSQFEKRVILQKYPAIRDKLHVVPNGVNNRFNDRYNKEELKRFRHKYGLPADFVLLLGNTAPKKNTLGALTAYEHYCSISPNPLPLVVADYRTIKPNIICPGYIPPEEMPLLYSAASIFIYPSFRESFGLPVLEAMACAVPVIASNTSAIPEIAGDAAMLVDPANPVRIGEAIHSLLADSSLMNLYKQKGLARASQFSWKNSARELIRIYSSV